MKKMVQRILLSFLVVLLVSQVVLPREVQGKSSSNVGIDVSRFNDTVDWEKVVQAGYRYVMIKTGAGTEPADFQEDVDPKFYENYQGAKDAGLKVGVYHLCGVNGSDQKAAIKKAKTDAEYCLKILDGRELDYPVAYDMELAGTFAGGKETTTLIAEAFCEVIAEAGYEPMVYSTAEHLREDFQERLFGEYKIWVAHYGTGEPNIPYPCDMWQFSNTSKVDGANTNGNKGVCDVNYSFLEAEGLTLNKGKITLGVGESYSLKAELLPEDTTDDITFSSGKKSVAKVSSQGKITGKAKGSAKITGKTGSGLEAVCEVTVKKAPGSVSFQQTPTSLKVGQTYSLKVKLPSGTASYKKTWKSSQTSVATISSKGVITAKKKGTTKITVKTYNGKTKSFTLKVK